MKHRGPRPHAVRPRDTESPKGRPVRHPRIPRHIIDDWYHNDPGPQEPLQIEGRGVLGPAMAMCGAFVVGLVVWSVVFSPEPVVVDIEAMIGLDNQMGADPMLGWPEPGEQGWAASISEEANYSGDAVPLPAPQPGDWLYHFPEQGQTYQQFLLQAQSQRDLVHTRDKLYVVPLGKLPSKYKPVMKATAEYLSAYYDAPTRILPVDVMPTNAYHKKRGQYDARGVLDALAARLPSDAIGLVGVTTDDLFIPSVNFVFGLGSFRQRVAVFSIHRYGDDYSLSGDTGTLLRRSMTVATHELGHVMSMRHCTAYRCVMNGTSSLEEADRHTLHLCPVCRRKAEHVRDWHREDRYANLKAFYERFDFGQEAEFVERRLEPPTVEFITENTQEEDTGHIPHHAH